MSTPRRFEATVQSDGKGVLVPVPFDPDDVWGRKARHHVTGTIDGKGVRGVVRRKGDRFGLSLGPAWARDCGVEPGARVAVALTAEGPQRSDLAPDVAAALDAAPAAGEFFDALAQFYRRGYLRWIDATKRRPDVRAQRIAEMVRLLEAGRKERPGS